ncbi:GNAT family N-acetyltransferase [Kribbella sp. NPDC051620]|uniref:GNAT family N-acetyltransferase n=1 Tax=Kribbella sp. NPDC051620 TaxID=3364120 RepID=UPI00379B50BE
MSWPAAVEVRPFDAANLEELVEVVNAIAAADRSGEYVDAVGLARVVGAAADGRTVWKGTRLVGYSLIDDETVKGGIHPEHRRQGIGRPLFEWATRRALESFATVDVELQSIDDGGRVLALANGYEPTRYYSSMQRPYAEPPIVTHLAEGFRLIPFAIEYDGPLRLAHNEIFVDHWGVEPKTEDDWQRWFTGHRGFRPALSRLVLDGERIAAYALAYEYSADTEATGVRELWIGQVGTRREYRGRGLASAVMAEVLRAGEEAGFERAGLNVDAASPTGAHRLYEQLGFRTVHSKVLYRLTRDA